MLRGARPLAPPAFSIFSDPFEQLTIQQQAEQQQMHASEAADGLPSANGKPSDDGSLYSPTRSSNIQPANWTGRSKDSSKSSSSSSSSLDTQAEGERQQNAWWPDSQTASSADAANGKEQLQESEQGHQEQQQQEQEQEQHQVFSAFVPWPGRADASQSAVAAQPSAALIRQLQVVQQKGLAAAAAASSSSSRSHQSSVGRAVWRQASKLKRLTSNFLSRSALTSAAAFSSPRPAAMPSASGVLREPRILVGEDALLAELPLEAEATQRSLEPLFAWSRSLEWMSKGGSNAESGVVTLLSHSSPLKAFISDEGDSSGRAAPVSASSATAAAAAGCSVSKPASGLVGCPYIPAFEEIIQQLGPLMPRPANGAGDAAETGENLAVSSAAAEETAADAAAAVEAGAAEETAGAAPAAAANWPSAKEALAVAGSPTGVAHATADAQAAAEAAAEAAVAEAAARDSGGLGLLATETGDSAEEAACLTEGYAEEAEMPPLEETPEAKQQVSPHAAAAADAEGLAAQTEEANQAAQIKTKTTPEEETVYAADMETGMVTETVIADEEGSEAAAEAAAEATEAAAEAAAEAEAEAAAAGLKGPSADEETAGVTLADAGAAAAIAAAVSEPVAFSPIGDEETAAPLGTPGMVSIEVAMAEAGVEAPGVETADVETAAAVAAAASTPKESAFLGDDLQEACPTTSSRQAGSRCSEEDGETLEAHQLRLGLSEFPEWLMQVDADADEDRQNPYKAVRLRKTGLRSYKEGPGADEAAAYRMRSRLEGLRAYGGRGKQQARLSSGEAATPEAVSGDSSRSTSRAPEAPWRQRQQQQQARLSSSQSTRKSGRDKHASAFLLPPDNDTQNNEAPPPPLAEGITSSVSALRARFERKRSDWFQGEFDRFSRRTRNDGET